MNDQTAINQLKGLIIDGVGQAKSGHPGGAMSSLDFAYLLFTEFLNFDPENPDWQGRDRFILSAGHESMLMYSLLHMNGWLEMEELKRFRQLHSKTPGHPENFLTPGVECTTGPLGQGAAMSVGFAFNATHLKAKLDDTLFDYNTYALLGDGCMQEDVTLGAASLAGHLGLNNLVWYYDRNRVQISGMIDRVTSDNEKKVFEGFGWEVREIDGHDHTAIRESLNYVNSSREKPLLIIGNTTMAKGAFSMEGKPGAHGAPFKPDEAKATKEKLGLNGDAFFEISEECKNHYRRNFSEKSKVAQDWKNKLDSKIADKDFETTYNKYFKDTNISDLPQINWEEGGKMATRNSFGKIIEEWADHLPQLVGGSADLEPSNMTGGFAKKVGDFLKDNPGGRNIAFGVREFPMSAMANGIALAGGLIPFDATFLSFADYSRPALRLGAIQKARVIHEFTHDSFYLGEDGPTHQPIEHVMSLRTIPDFLVMRPADSFETEVMMRQALSVQLPSAICLSRQGLPHLPRTSEQQGSVARGAYVIQDTNEKADAIVFTSGSEVSLALEAAKELSTKGFGLRIVSVPCWELFWKQDASYIESILDKTITKRISIEAGTTLGWERFTGWDGLNIGIDHYGESAPAGDLAEAYGFTPAKVAKRISEFFQ